MTLIIGYNFRITIEDQMYCDLVEGTTDILTIPFTKDSIFKRRLSNTITMYKS